MLQLRATPRKSSNPIVIDPVCCISLVLNASVTQSMVNNATNCILLLINSSIDQFIKFFFLIFIVNQMLQSLSRL